MRKSKIRLMCLRQLQQSIQIEQIRNNACPGMNGVECIAGLFDMSRNHQDRFTQVHGLADRLEARSRGIGFRSCHITDKQRVI